MRAAVAGFTLGIFLLQQQAELAGWPVLIPLAAGAVLFMSLSFLKKGITEKTAFRRALRFAAGVLFGFFWASAFALYYLADDLPEYLEGKNIVVTGTVDSLPKLAGSGKSFAFRVEHAGFSGHPVTVPARILLSWNEPFRKDGAASVPDVEPGERWRLHVRLRRPHGNANPEGFDYEAWLLGQNIRATGYVRMDPKTGIENRRLDDFAVSFGNIVNRARSRLRSHILDALPDARYAGVIVALVIGDQKGIETSDWNIFNRTGISHLVSISGFHITLISGMFAAFVSFLWRHSFFTRARLPLVLPAQKVAAAGGALMAWIYVLLAGFGLPAQRTLYMLMVVAIALWTGRIARVSHVLFAALAVALLFDPWAVLAPGFWLSFAAVGCILYLSAGRRIILRRDTPQKTRWLHALKNAAHIQLGLTIGLIPLTLLFFGRISLVSPLANAIAIPLVGTVITPVAIFGSVMPSILARPVLGVAHYLMEILVMALEVLSTFPLAVLTAPIPSAWLFLVAIPGTLWMLAPKGWPARWLGLACWFPVFLARPASPPGGEVQAVALDVGQGSAVLIETRSHRLLYDTGPVYTADANAGSRVIIPYLNARNITSLDTVIISHGDMDHAGGAQALFGDPDLAIGEVFSPLTPDDPLLKSAPRHRACLAGQEWEWDGVTFEILGPTVGIHLAQKDRHHANAVSCVLKVTAGSQSMLLPGDISVREESGLLARMPEKLKSDILLAPHHGSSTSSSLPFLATVRPSIAIFQMGYRNRYGHPDDTVYARYGVLDIRRMRTDEEGAITVRFGRKVEASGWKSHRKRYWQGR